MQPEMLLLPMMTTMLMTTSGELGRLVAWSLGRCRHRRTPTTNILTGLECFLVHRKPYDCVCVCGVCAIVCFGCVRLRNDDNTTDGLASAQTRTHAHTNSNTSKKVSYYTVVCTIYYSNMSFDVFVSLSYVM